MFENNIKKFSAATSGFSFSKKKEDKELLTKTEEALTDTQKKFREHRKQEAEAMKIQGDTNYWTMLVFPTKELAIEFSRVMKLDVNEQFVDGIEFGEKLGIKFKSPIPKKPKFKQNSTWNRFINK
jgi:hypothetical protein